MTDDLDNTNGIRRGERTIGLPCLVAAFLLVLAAALSGCGSGEASVPTGAAAHPARYQSEMTSDLMAEVAPGDNTLSFDLKTL